MAPVVQKFRSTANGEIVFIEVNFKDNSILWKHVLRSFGDVAKVCIDKMDIHFMTDEGYEDLSPLRIEAQLDSVMDVVLHGKIPEKNYHTESLPDYNKQNGEKLPFANYITNLGDEYIRFGSRISLRHIVTGSLVRSVNWKYKSGTQQHAVIGSDSKEPELEDVWQVVPATGNTNAEEINLKLGEKIRYDTCVRLFNVTYRRWLHSHSGYTSPITDQQEVTTIGSENETDANDVWIVTRVENGTEIWKTSEYFLLRHETTDNYLHSHMEIFKGGKEITCSPQNHNIDSIWRAALV